VLDQMDGQSNIPRHVGQCTVYFDDLDAIGMLYNGRYIAMIERGMAAVMARMGLPPGHEDVINVVREIQLIFGDPIRQPGTYDLTFWATDIGRSSATLEFRVESNGVEHVHGHRTVTKYDPTTGKSKPWSTEILDKFGARST
jgi:acyl-CoA thioester hydrolase